MSIQSGDHHVDEVLAGLHQGLAEVRRLWQQARNLLDRWQRGRTSVEDLLNRRTWDPELDRAIPPQENQSQQAEFAALQAYERDLAAQVQQYEARIAELESQRDQSLNDDLDRDGIDDRVQNRTDRDRDGIDDNVEDDERAAEDIEDAHDRDGDGIDDAVQDRQQDQAEADADRQRRQDQERQSRENAEPGLDPTTTAEAAAGTAVAAEAVDEELGEPGVDANARDQAIDSEQQAGPEAAQSDGNVVSIGQGDNSQQNVVDWNPERDGHHIDAQPNTVYRVQGEGGVSFSYNGEAEQDSPGMDMQDMGRDAADANRESINVGNISGNNQTFVVDQNGVHEGIQDGDRLVADTRQPAQQTQQVQNGQQTEAGQHAEQTQQGQDGRQAEQSQEGEEAQQVQQTQQAQEGQRVEQGQQGQEGQQVQRDQQGQQVEQGQRAEVGQPGQDGLQAGDGRQSAQGQQPEEAVDQPAFPTAGDAAEANRVQQQSQTQQGGQTTQQAAQVENREAQEKPVLDGLRTENAENRAKNPPARSQTEMSPDEIDQQHHVNAGLPSAAEAPGYDSGELANAGSSGQRDYADRARTQSSRSPDRGNDGPGLSR
ncbi:hypothetical protein GCM10009630_47580 [Kribbella jejuensis]|uniref:Uncharacterized protein n=1 Tax=Kribbella jejuensis TaxID=236068 RepID=A0A542E7B1_9ACTN|nr:hypothetical protein [Kribbella jejuensis]TQJ11146.1 hypothetical protein FB475_4054 [Kribbella jejuensis]